MQNLSIYKLSQCRSKLTAYASHYLPNLELSDMRGRDNVGMTAITSPEPEDEVGVSNCLQISRLLRIQSEGIFSRKQNDLVIQKARIFLERTCSH